MAMAVVLVRVRVRVMVMVITTDDLAFLNIVFIRFFIFSLFEFRVD